MGGPYQSTPWHRSMLQLHVFFFDKILRCPEFAEIDAISNLFKVSVCGYISNINNKDIFRFRAFAKHSQCRQDGFWSHCDMTFGLQEPIQDDLMFLIDPTSANISYVAYCILTIYGCLKVRTTWPKAVFCTQIGQIDCLCNFTLDSMYVLYLLYIYILCYVYFYILFIICAFIYIYLCSNYDSMYTYTYICHILTG